MHDFLRYYTHESLILLIVCTNYFTLHLPQLWKWIRPPTIKTGFKLGLKGPVSVISRWQCPIYNGIIKP